MNAKEHARFKEVEQLRRAVEQAEALCATLDRCEFAEPIDFDADIDARRALDSLRIRLARAERSLLASVVRQNGGGVMSLCA